MDQVVNKQLKSYVRSSILGFFFTFIVGTLLHFAYDFSGENFFISLIAPINESVWEHLKLLFFPVLLYTFGELLSKNEAPSSLFTANMIGVVIGMFTIPILFYSYTFLLDTNYLWLDITIFIIGIIVTFLVRNYLLKNQKLDVNSNFYGCLFFFLIIVLFFSFTVNPPELGIFIDYSAK